MARVLLRSLAENRALAPAFGLIERLDTKRRDVLRVVTYHRVDHAAPFERQVEHLARHYAIVSIAEVLESIDGGHPLPPRAMLLSFDDAHRSFADVAWPILSRRGLASVLFVPTAFPGSREERFWWDRLDEAFARTPRRDRFATPVGEWSLATAESRASARRAVKLHVKELPHVEVIAATRSICAELLVPLEQHEVLDWDELRALSRAGVSLGAHTRTHPRLDRVSFDEARTEITGSLEDLEREVPGLPRLFAYPDGRFSDELVGTVRDARVELAFTTRTGTNDLRRADRLRLRRIFVDAGDSLEVLRAKLALNSPRWSRVRTLVDPPSADERRCERAVRAERRSTRTVHRSLDALLNGAVGSKRSVRASFGALTRLRSPHYERMRALAGVAAASSALATRMRRALLDTSRLPFPVAGIEILGYGTGATVFGLESDGGTRPHVLKVYRRTLGRPLRTLLAIARRHRERYRQLCAWFGEAVLPAHFVVLHGPLKGLASVAILQERTASSFDPLALDDAALVARLRALPELASQFVVFARRTLEVRRQGFFPDLLGPGNLLVLDGPGAPRLRMIDYGLFDSRVGSKQAREARVDALARRFEGLLRELEQDGMADGRTG